MLNNVRNYFRRPVQLMILVACLTAFFIFFTMFDAWYVNQYLNNTLDPSDFGADRCNWKLGDPVLLNLKTKLGVNYEGSHWFHMAENLMTQHSILRNEAKNKDQNTIRKDSDTPRRYDEIAAASDIYLNLDKESMLGELNSMTRLIISLGLVGLTHDDTVLVTQNVYFVYIGNDHLPKVESNSMKLGGDADSINRVNSPVAVMPLHDLKFRKCQVVNIGRHVNSSQKFELDPTVTCSHITSGSYSQGDIQRHLRVLTLESDAFSTKNGKEQWHEHHPTCVKFVQPNHVGGDWPTPQRGHWFPPSVPTEENHQRLDDNLVSFYNKLDLMCIQSPKLAAAVTTYHVTIYQRNLNRKILNMEETVEMVNAYILPHIRKSVNDPSIKFELNIIMHDNARSPCEIREMLRDTVLLMTPHGFQSLLTLFLPNGKGLTPTSDITPLLFEIFPYRYYKRAYGPLSKEIGVYHSSTMSAPLLWDRQMVLQYITTNGCMMLSKYCREYARNDNVLFSYRGLNILLYEINTKILPQFNTKHALL